MSIGSILSGKLKIDNNTWVSSSKLYNFFNDDPLLDWLELFGKSNSLLPDKEIEYLQYQKECSDKGLQSMSMKEFCEKRDESSFRMFLMKQGQQFEQFVIDCIKQQFPNLVVDVGNQSFGKFDYVKKLQFTISCMQQQIPFIYQGFVCHPQKRFFGFPDLLVREDHIHHLTGEPQNSSCSSTKYVVFDIKFKMLDYKKNVTNLRCSSSQNFFISQLFIYSDSLQSMVQFMNDQSNNNSNLNIDDECAYVIGRDWNIERPNEFVGKVRFGDVPEIINKVCQGISWIRDLRKQGQNWSVYSPSRLELYPNMKNDKDNEWKQSKLKISNQTKELTTIWNIGPATRNQMVLQNVRSWSSPKINDTFLKQFISSDYQRSIILQMIQMNKQNNNNNNDNNNNPNYTFDPTMDIPLLWKSNDVRQYLQNVIAKTNAKNTIVYDGFIDIETLVDVFSISNTRNDSLCYLIGIYYNRNPFSSKHKKYQTSMQYYPLVSKNITVLGEKQLIHNFLQFLKMGEIDRPVVWRMYYYSQFEKTMMEKLFSKYKIFPKDFGIEIEWAFDLHGLFTSYQFIFKNCFDYSLKSINKAMVKSGLIPEEFCYSACKVQDGTQSVIIAHECHNKAIQNNCQLMDIESFDSIVNYNMVDCVSLFYIRNFMESCINSFVQSPPSLEFANIVNCDENMNE